MRLMVCAGRMVGALAHAQQPDTAQQCVLLKKAIEANDAQARRGGSAQQMERLREERRRIRQRQSELGC